MKTNTRQLALLFSVLAHLLLFEYLAQHRLERQYLGQQQDGMSLDFDERLFSQTIIKPSEPKPSITTTAITPIHAIIENDKNISIEEIDAPLPISHSTAMPNDSLPLAPNTEQLNDSIPKDTTLVQSDSTNLQQIDTTGLIVYSSSFVDSKPSFPDGFEAMLAFFSTNLQHPAEAPDRKGTVHIELIILENGQFANLRVKKTSFEDFPAFQTEALRVAAKMPRWLPGKINNVAVKTCYTIPVVFP